MGPDRVKVRFRCRELQKLLDTSESLLFEKQSEKNFMVTIESLQVIKEISRNL